MEASGRRRCGGGAVERGGGREVRGNGERDEGVQVPYLARAEVEWGGLATRAIGDGRRWPWRWHCKAKGEACGGGRVCGAEERRGGGSFYRRSMSVEQCGAG